MKKAFDNKLLKDTLEAQGKRITRMRDRKNRYPITAGGKKLIVLPKVFYPGKDSILMIETVRFNKGDVVLDSCSGTGIFAIFDSADSKGWC